MAAEGRPEVLALGVDAGLEILPGSPEWGHFLVSPGLLETVQPGFTIRGTFLGCESEGQTDEVAGVLEDGSVHLCAEEPCITFGDGNIIHATRFRLWRPDQFNAEYLTRAGAAALKKAVAKLAKVQKPAAPRKEPRKKPAAKTPPSRTPRPRTTPRRKSGEEEEKETEPVIPVPSGSEEEEAKDPPGRGELKSILKRTRERILGQTGSAKRPKRGEDVSGGPDLAGSGRVAGSRQLVAGTSLNLRRQTPLGLADERDTSDADTRGLMRRLTRSGNASSALLAQAVQSSALTLDQRKKKRRSSEKDKLVKALTSLIQGKKDKKKKRRERTRRRSRSQGQSRMKPDPDGQESPDPSGSSSEYSSDEGDHKGDKSDADSELSFEAPLRKRALRDPGSVMDMLVRHAQQQLDQGALLEAEGAQPSVTSGVKISTYFALLIRPYHTAGSPLLRKLYSLAQAIDLLRMGRLPETADALASRFVAVHTALSEGNWTTAAQLELYPLEPVQSASTATMLEAHKHRRLVMKSQGWQPTSRWWSATGRGKGATQAEKGKKGDGKRNKGKGKGAGKEGSWSQKGDAGNNPWANNKEEAPKK
eukprot:s823_g6.t1